MEMKDMNIMGLIGIIGAVILVIGVFMGWVHPDLNDKTYTGWDLYNNVDNIADSAIGYSGMNYTYVPLIALICGIISLALMIMPTIMNVEKFAQINNILGIVALILAIVVVICGILWYTQEMTVLAVTKPMTEFGTVEAGFWLVLVGGIITMLGGLMPILKNKGIIKF